MYCDLWSQYVKVRKLFKGGNYSRKYGKWFCQTSRGCLLIPEESFGFWSKALSNMQVVQKEVKTHIYYFFQVWSCFCCHSAFARFTSFTWGWVPPIAIVRPCGGSFEKYWKLRRKIFFAGMNLSKFIETCLKSSKLVLNCQYVSNLSYFV